MLGLHKQNSQQLLHQKMIKYTKAEQEEWAEQAHASGQPVTIENERKLAIVTGERHI